MAEFKNATSYSYSPGYTFPGNLPTELFYNASIGSTPMSDIFTIRQGIRTDEYLVLVSTLEKLVRATTGCEPSYTTSGTLSDRKISVAKISANLQWCKSDFISTASALSNDPKFVADGLDGYDVTSAVRKMWMDQMVDGIRKDIARLVMFGNDTSGNANYNIMEGLLVKLLDGGASYCVKQVGNNFPNQFNSVLTTDQALDALKALVTGAQIPLKQLPPQEKVLWVTGSVAENLIASYESKTAGSEIQFRYLENGIPSLKFRGIDVKWDYLWDNYLEDSVNPWYNNMRHFAILTPKASSKFSNLVMGTERASDLDRIDMFYDQRLLTTYAQYEGRIGVNFVRCDLTSIYH
jgi:hypothetical protein